jgi:cyclase
MLKKRVIPVILLRNGVIVQSKGFKRYQNLGSPTAAVERLSNWAADELIYLDISPYSFYDLRRDDLNHPAFNSIIEIINLVSRKCFMPLTVGGGIRNIEDVYQRLKSGADKITLNTRAIEEPDFITECAKEFGTQCIVISIDVKRIDNKWRVYKGGKILTDMSPVSWARTVQDYGAGEILLNSIDKDGLGAGYDLELINKVSENISIPVIAMGGAGKWQHLEEVLNTKASAAALANILHHSENSLYNAKKYLYDRGYNIRKPLPLSKSRKNL